MAGHVRVPGVGVDQIGVVGQCRDHGQIGSEHAQGRIRPGREVLGMGDHTVAGLTHALHIDVDEITKTRHQLGHVHARAAVDGRGVLASENGCMHTPIVSHAA